MRRHVLQQPVSRRAAPSGSAHPASVSQTGVATAPGIDFDPIDGRRFIRFCYAGAQHDVAEAVTRGVVAPSGAEGVARAARGLDPARVAAIALLDGEGMGEEIRVLVQARGVDPGEVLPDLGRLGA